MTSLMSIQDGKMGMVMNLVGMKDIEMNMAMCIGIHARGK